MIISIQLYNNLLKKVFFNFKNIFYMIIIIDNHIYYKNVY